MLSQAFEIENTRSICIIGCGGKTSLMYALADENYDRSVLITTTTHILAPRDGQIKKHEALLALPSAEPGKLKGVSPEELERESAKYCLTLIEGDGSKGLPLKGWAEYEPVIPEWVEMTIGVCTLWPVGLVAGEDIICRLDAFERQTGAKRGEEVTIGHVAAMAKEMFKKAAGRKVLFVNQAEEKRAKERAGELLKKCGKRDFDIVIGSIKENWAEKIT